ncbi:MAG: acyl-CoA dehydrogenase [Candidatus Hatepunaea meridiana]|nr:acyl-CoA dehydrogenase [Candidatus Hatepunaea meridiana]
MDFKYTEEQQMVRETIREFALAELAPGVAERDEKEIYPTKAMKKLGELGFMGVTLPEELGGAGLDMISYCIAVEELARVDASTAIIISVTNSLAVYPIELFSNDNQKERFLRPLGEGKMLGAFALTEPEAGSDAGGMKTTAVKDGDDYILNGAKAFITSGINCDIVLVFVVTDKEKGMKGTSAIIVEKGTPGFEAGKRENKMGIRGSDTAPISFEDCRVPAANMLGAEGMGFKIAMTALNSGRIGVASQALGIAQASLDESVKYSKERVQFSRPIAKFQAIQFKIAKMATEIEAARMLLYSAAARKDRHENYIKEAAMAKLFCSEVAVRSALEAVQIHGGYGYIKEYPVERFMRDSKITTIYEGTNEIMNIVIADQVIGR